MTIRSEKEILVLGRLSTRRAISAIVPFGLLAVAMFVVPPLLSRDGVLADVAGPNIAAKFLPLGWLAALAALAFCSEVVRRLLTRDKAGLYIRGNKIVYIAEWWMSTPVSDVTGINTRFNGGREELIIERESRGPMYVPMMMFSNSSSEISNAVKSVLK